MSNEYNDIIFDKIIDAMHVASVSIAMQNNLPMDRVDSIQDTIMKAIAELNIIELFDEPNIGEDQDVEGNT